MELFALLEKMQSKQFCQKQIIPLTMTTCWVVVSLLTFTEPFTSAILALGTGPTSWKRTSPPPKVAVLFAGLHKHVLLFIFCCFFFIYYLSCLTQLAMTLFFPQETNRTHLLEKETLDLLLSVHERDSSQTILIPAKKGKHCTFQQLSWSLQVQLTSFTPNWFECGDARELTLGPSDLCRICTAQHVLQK